MKNRSVLALILVAITGIFLAYFLNTIFKQNKPENFSVKPSISENTPKKLQEIEGWTVGLLQKSPNDDFQDLIITKGSKIRLLGKVEVYGGSESYDVDRRQKRIIFIGKSQEDVGQNTAQDILVYSVELDRILKRIKWPDISSALKITGHINANLNRISVSPNGNFAAASFGYILEADYESRIVVFDLGSRLVKVIPQKGLVKGWKDDKTILYEVETSEKQEGSLYPKKAILEAKVD